MLSPEERQLAFLERALQSKGFALKWYEVDWPLGAYIPEARRFGLHGVFTPTDTAYECSIVVSLEQLRSAVFDMHTATKLSMLERFISDTVMLWGSKFEDAQVAVRAAKERAQWQR